MSKINTPDDRLLEILEEVHSTEGLPELTCDEERELIGEHKLVWDFGHDGLYWLTKEGLDIMLSLQGQRAEGRNAFKAI